VLYEPGQRIPYVHFPTKGVIATTVRMADGRSAEAGMVGREGMVCPCILLECDTTPFEAVVQNAGEALRMKSENFKVEVRRSKLLSRLMHRYVDAFLCMVSQSAACNCLHSLEQRCARWLLMTLDRAEADQFLLTQDSLARQLGVLRTSVSEVAHRIQGAGLIRYSRGKVTVLDRKGLEAASCECYVSIKAKFDSFLGSR
jgi:CRP-like cAMP-binding protein